jgi:hypothetical protein
MMLVKLLFFLLILVILVCLIMIVLKAKKDTMIDLKELQGKKTNLNFIAKPFPSLKPPILRKCIGKNQCS